MIYFFEQVVIIAGKDLRSEFRTKGVMNAAVSFSVVVLLLFSFVLERVLETDVREVSGGLLWMVYLFAGILILNRSFAREAAGDCLDALVSSPISGGAIFLGKVLANWTLLLVVECISLPLFGIFYDVHWSSSSGYLLLVFGLGTWGLTVVGTIFGALTVNNRLRELMLPLLVFPITLPVLMACVELTALVLTGQGFGDSIIWLKLLVGFGAIFSLLGVVLLDEILVS